MRHGLLNALARQIQRELQLRLRQAPLNYHIKVLTGAYEIEDTDLSTMRAEDVIITTPEKLDALLRHSAEDQVVQRLLDRCCLVVLDELHNVGEGRRGLTYEFLIARMRSRLPSAELLCLSPRVSNIDSVSRWINSEIGGISTDWRPTRLHYATWSSEGLYFDGSWRYEAYKRSPEGQEDVARIALELQLSYASVLIMATTRATAESYARRIWEHARNESRYALSGDDIGELTALANYVRRRTYSGSMLARFIETGIAYHHAHVPSDIRSRIEDLIIKRHLKIVVSTTTLAEGVNLPVKCVVLLSIYFGSTPISPLKLQNIFGRAARAGFTTEGQAVVFQKGKAVYANGRFFNFYQYCFSPPDEFLQVNSSLGFASVEADSLANLELLQALDSQVLGMFLDGTAPNDNHAEVISRRTLLAVNAPESIENAQELVATRMERMKKMEPPLLAAASPLTLTDYGKRAAYVGLGVDETQLLVSEFNRRMDAAPNCLASARNNDGKLSRDFVDNLLIPSYLLPRNLFSSQGVMRRCKEILGVSVTALREHMQPILQSLLRGDAIYVGLAESITKEDVEAIYSWLDGKSETEFAELFLPAATRGRETKRQEVSEKKVEEALMDAIHYFEQVSTTLSYCAFMVEGIARMVADSRSSPVSPELGNCYVYLKYGVNHPIAVFLMKEAGICERSRAIRIAADLPGEFSYNPGLCARLLRPLGSRAKDILDESEYRSLQRALRAAEPYF